LELEHLWSRNSTEHLRNLCWTSESPKVWTSETWEATLLQHQLQKAFVIWTVGLSFRMASNDHCTTNAPRWRRLAVRRRCALAISGRRVLSTRWPWALDSISRWGQSR
jgi:hypothetical protein